jgi:DNA-binding NtrC family response regulator
MTSMPESRPLPKVLFVDDLHFCRMLFVRTMQQSFEVMTAGSVDEAVEMLEKWGASTFCAVVTDYDMPERTGLDLLHEVKARDPALETLFVSSKVDDFATIALNAGAFGSVRKGVPVRELRSHVANAVGRTGKRRTL